MRSRRLIGLIAFILSLWFAPAIGAEPVAEPDAKEETATAETINDRAPSPSVDIDLGTATLGHLETGLGPFAYSLGLFDRLMLGSYTMPWMAAAVVPTVTAGNVDALMPNLFAKAEVIEHNPFRASVSASLFYLRIGNIDDNSFEIGALLIPIRGLLSVEWDPFHSTILELATVQSALGGALSVGGILDVDANVEARSTHAGLTHRIRLSDGVALWGRVRTLLGNAMVRASFSGSLSDYVEVDGDARANTAELSSGFTGSAGLHLGHTRYGLKAGAGYGTWFMPGIYIPIGRNLPFLEFNLYFRF